MVPFIINYLAEFPPFRVGPPIITTVPNIIIYPLTILFFGDRVTHTFIHYPIMEQVIIFMNAQGPLIQGGLHYQTTKQNSIIIRHLTVFRFVTEKHK